MCLNYLFILKSFKCVQLTELTAATVVTLVTCRTISVPNSCVLHL